MELQVIQNRIFEVRGYRIIMDFHLAELYNVETRSLKQAVKRNKEMFPSDFMINLTKEEWTELITNCDKLPENIRHNPIPPSGFTEQGVAMLSSVLRSKTAIEVNISIMRAFVAIRQQLCDYSSVSQEIESLRKHLKSLENQVEENLKAINDLNEDNQNSFDEIYLALTELAKKHRVNDSKPRNRVGFIQEKSND